MPRWLLPTTTAYMLGTSAITPWVVHNFGFTVAGSFAFAIQILAAPAALLAQAVNAVVFPRLADSERSAGVEAAEVESILTRMASVSFVVFLPVLALGPQLFGWVFGAQWEQAGQFASILVPWVAANFVSMALSSLALVKGRYRQVLTIALGESLLRYLALWVGGLLDSATVGVALYSIAGVLISLNYIAWMMRLVGESFARMLGGHLRPLAKSGLALLALLAARSVLDLVPYVMLTAFVTVGLAGITAMRMSGRCR